MSQLHSAEAKPRLLNTRSEAFLFRDLGLEGYTKFFCSTNLDKPRLEQRPGGRWFTADGEKIYINQ